MKNRIEDIFDQDLKNLHKGSLSEEIVSSYSKDEKEKLIPLLKLAKSLVELPKKSIPKPVMQKKFILMPIKTFWFSWFHLSRLTTVSVGAILLITAIAGTGYASMKSIPGQTLFAVKKNAEQLRIKFARSPEAKMSLQLELSKKRLDDAEKVLKNPSSGPYQTNAVITELVAQTQNTVDEIGKATRTNPNSITAQPIVKSMENLASQQQQLIKEIKPENEEIMVANAEKVTQETATKLAEIKKYILTAGNEQALVDIKSLEKTEGGEANKEQANVETIAKPVPTTTTQTLQKSIEPETIEKDPNTVTGTFIFEDPSPQFKP